MYEIGLAQGRFHIIHHGHIEYLLESKKRCEYLIIGITDPDPERAYFPYKEIEEIDRKSKIPFRSIKDPIFPFTFYERKKMIKLSMIESGINPSEFDIVPLPIHKPYLIKYYVPLNAVVFITIYDGWGRKKPRIFKNLGYKTEILWEKDLKDRFTTGTEVRKRIINNEDWKDLVPKSVYEYIVKNKLDKILRGKNGIRQKTF